MKYAKITVKNNYDKKGDLVHRELIRAFKQFKLDSLIYNDSIIIPGIIQENDIFCVPFTGQLIEYHNYEEITFDEYRKIVDNLSLEEHHFLSVIIYKYIFKESIRWIDEHKLEDYYDDRIVELRAYENGLSTVDPYEKGHLNDYNDFLYKCKESERVLKKVV